MELLNAENELAQIWQVLVATIGNAAMPQMLVEGDIEKDLPAMDSDSLLQTILSASPEVKTARANLERARATLERAKAEQIRWINDFQRSLLDWFLKANSVEEGVRSYSRVVLTAAATEPYWSRFR